AVSVLFCIPTLFLFDRSYLADDPLTIGTAFMLLAVGITATIGQIFLTRAFAAGIPAKVSVVGLTQVVFAMLFDAMIWEKSFSFLTVVGIVLVLAPTAWLLLRRA